MKRCILAGVAVSLALAAQTAILPLREVKSGMKGVGRTVFSGDRVEDFQADILGVLENAGPGQAIILARLSGGPLARTGVMQGMSGSPVYVDGKLIGAVALAFTFATEPIAGIRPIEEMLQVPRGPVDNKAAAPGPRTEFAWNGGSRLVELATPVSFSGFSRAAVEHFAPELKKFGLEPMQGALGGGAASTKSNVVGDPKRIQPGSMISVQLMTGDMSVGADGTVTMIDGDRVYAFGHRFLAGGPSALPFARSEVLALLPNLTTSFKISSSREHMGVITQDRNAAISGVFGKPPAMIPLTVNVKAPGTSRSYHMEMVHDRTFAPLLTQMAIFSALDGTERSLGPGTFTVRGAVEFEGGLPPVRLDNTFASDLNAPVLTAVFTSIPLTYLMQSGFENLRIKAVQVEINGTDSRNSMQLDQAWSSSKEVRAGESLELNLSLLGDNGAELFKKVSHKLPVGISTGPLYVTITDGMTSNYTELMQAAGTKSRTPSQVIQLLNSMRRNDRMFVKLWRPEPAYPVPGAELPAPPASIGLVLARMQTAGSIATNTGRGAKVAEFEIDLGGAIASGTKTIQVEVKE